MTAKPRFSIRSFFSSFWYYFKGVFRRMHDEEGLLFASGIAFNAVLCSIPILLLFTSFLGIFLHSSEEAMLWIDDVIDIVFPNQPYVETIKNSIKDIIGDVIANRTSYGIVGAAALVWTGTSLFSSVRNALHRMFRITSTKNLLLSIIEDIIWVFVAGGLFIMLNLVSWIYKLVEMIISQLPRWEGFDVTRFEAALPIILSFVLTLFMFFIVYRFIPDVAPSSKVAWGSAITAAILWETAARLFGWYLAEFQSFGELYGTYAFLLVLLIWIYFSSIVFLVGGVLGQLYGEKHPKK